MRFCVCVIETFIDAARKFIETFIDVGSEVIETLIHGFKPDIHVAFEPVNL